MNELDSIFFKRRYPEGRVNSERRRESSVLRKHLFVFVFVCLAYALLFHVADVAQSTADASIHGGAYVISNQDPRCTQKPI